MSLAKNKKILFVLCLLFYALAYLCRLNFSAAMPQMLTGGQYTSQEVGFVTSLFFLTYGIGQLINGYLGDRLSPRYLFFAGLFFSGICNIGIGFVSDVSGMSVFWALNGLFQSMLWPPIIYMIGAYYEKEEKNKIVKYFSLSVPLGTLLSYGVSLTILQMFRWEFVFYIAGGILVVIAVIWFVLSIGLFKTLQKNTEFVAEPNNADRKEYKGFLKSFVFSGLLFMMIPVAVHGALKDSVTNWVPTFVSEIFETPTGLTMFLTMILPIVNVTGGFIAVIIQGKIKNETISCGIFFCFSTAVSLVLFFFAKYSLALSIVCLALLTNTMFAINLLTISLMPLHFSNFNKVSFVSGILNSVAYLGCALVNMAVGFLLEKFSWQGVMAFWVGLSAVALIISFAVSYHWGKFIKNKNLLKSRTNE